MDGVQTLTLITALLGVCGTVVTGWFAYQANRAQAEASRSTAVVTAAASEAERLQLQAEQLRQGLLDENERLQRKVNRQDERIEALETRLGRVEDENIDLRRRLRHCEERGMWDGATERRESAH